MSYEREKARAVGKEQCPYCLDSGQDNKALYADGSSACFSCNTQWMTNGDVIKDGKRVYEGSERAQEVKPKHSFTGHPLILDGEYTALVRRKIDLDICTRYDVQVGAYIGEPVIIFNRHKNSQRVRQKLKTADKRFIMTGMSQPMDMFGSNWFDTPKGKHIVVCEGELDAMATQQVVDDFHKFHCTSLNDGAGNVIKWLKEYSKNLMEYDSVIICLDSDDDGIKASQDFLKEFTYGVVKLVKLPMKDPNEMLMSGRGDDLKWLIYNAEPIKPSNVVTAKDLKARALKKPVKGPDWPWEGLTEITFGMRPACYLIFGPEGTGKTEIIRAVIEHGLNRDVPQLSAVFSFEQEPDDTLQRLAGARINKRVHIPTVEWTPEELEPHIDYYDEKVFLYEYKGALNFDDIIRSIYYLRYCKSVHLFVLDNLTALCSNPFIAGKRVSEHEYLSYVANTIKQIQKELNIVMIVVAHNSNDNYSKQVYVSTSPKDPASYNAMTSEDTQKAINKPGMTWESGRMASLEHIHGSSIIKKVFDWVFVIGRNRVSTDDIEHRTILMRALKCRLASEQEGREIKILYDYSTGQLIEISNNLKGGLTDTAMEVL